MPNSKAFRPNDLIINVFSFQYNLKGLKILVFKVSRYGLGLHFKFLEFY